jgi:polar amino acid transport system substrate-binding protein
MKRLFLSVFLIGVLLIIILPGCGQETLKIYIATDATWPPFEYVDEQTMDIVGFDIDLIKAIADEAGLDIEIINVGWDPLLAGMAQCQYDAAISAMTITDERKEVMLFSNPYFEAGQLVTVQFGNTDIASKEDLGGKTVGAQIGTTGSFEVEKIAGATLKTYDDIGLAMQDLMNGQIDAVIADNPLAMGYANANPDKLKTVGAVFTSEYYGIAVCKTKPEILERINEGLAKVKAEGVIDELILKWLAN